MYCHCFITHFPQNVPVKKIENRSIFGEDMDKSLWFTFWAILYIAKLCNAHNLCAVAEPELKHNMRSNKSKCKATRGEN